jgi:hypothetical protein
MSVVQALPTGRSGFPVWRCPSEVCGHPNDMLRGTCRKCGAYRPCEHFDGDAHCGDTPTHMFICGARCDPHAPGARKTSRETSQTIQEEAA